MTEYYGWDNWNDAYDHQSSWYFDGYSGWYEWADSLNAYGYSGNDYLAGDLNADALNGGSGSDTLYGEEGNDYLDAGYWFDSYWDYNYLNGGSGSDTLYSGAGNDILLGSNSTAYNSGEYDVLIGGGGYDTFVLGQSWGNSYQGYGHATISDFNTWEDQIQINWGSSGIEVRSWENFAGDVWSDTTIYSNGDLIGVVQDNTNLYWSDFNFV